MTHPMHLNIHAAPELPCSYIWRDMSLTELHTALLLAGRGLHADEIADGYSFSVFNAKGSKKRVIRLSSTSRAGVFEVKRAATFRATKERNATHRFSGTVAELLSIIDIEIAVIEAEAAHVARKGARTDIETTAVRPLAARLARAYKPVGTLRTFDPEIILDGVDISRELIYRWQIFDGSNALVGVYIGLARASQGPVRFNRYRNRVRGIQLGLPYSANPNRDYRKVHYALANALEAEAHIVFTYLCNCGPDESLTALESQLIAEHDSYGPAAHQLNEKP
ncbi:hypothetical protein [Caballeronia glebae]|uniref:hypothetical protein n=1 Tax=Caballeronia glebae TaxID=1777143 RepID=UPI0038BC5B0E